MTSAATLAHGADQRRRLRARQHRRPRRNVLAAPLVAPITWLGMLAAALAQLWPARRRPDRAALAGPPLACLLALARARRGRSGRAARARRRSRAGRRRARRSRCCRGSRGDAAPRSRRAARCARCWAPRRCRCVALAARAGLGTRPAGRRRPRRHAARLVPRHRPGRRDAAPGTAAHALLVDSGPPAGRSSTSCERAGVTRLSALGRDACAGRPPRRRRPRDRALPVGLLLDGRDGVREHEGAADGARRARARGVRDVAVHAGRAPAARRAASPTSCGRRRARRSAAAGATRTTARS